MKGRKLWGPESCSSPHIHGCPLSPVTQPHSFPFQHLVFPLLDFSINIEILVHCHFSH